MLTLNPTLTESASARDICAVCLVSMCAKCSLGDDPRRREFGGKTQNKVGYKGHQQSSEPVQSAGACINIRRRQPVLGSSGSAVARARSCYLSPTLDALSIATAEVGVRTRRPDTRPRRTRRTRSPTRKMFPEKGTPSAHTATCLCLWSCLCHRHCLMFVHFLCSLSLCLSLFVHGLGLGSTVFISDAITNKSITSSSPIQMWKDSRQRLRSNENRTSIIAFNVQTKETSPKETRDGRINKICNETFQTPLCWIMIVYLVLYLKNSFSSSWIILYSSTNVCLIVIYILVSYVNYTWKIKLFIK